MQDFNVV